jgi:hypothetical protein
MAGKAAKHDVGEVPAATPDKPITVAERKKAEELIKQRFEAVNEAIKNEVKDKLDALKDAWEQQSGVTKLLDKIEKKESELSALRKQLKAATDDEHYDRRSDSYWNNRGCRDDTPRMSGRFAAAKRRLKQAERHALESLSTTRCQTIEKLWFSILSKDALALVNSVPDVEALKSNGLALLKMPVKKLLTVKVD